MNRIFAAALVSALTMPAANAAVTHISSATHLGIDASYSYLTPTSSGGYPLAPFADSSATSYVSTLIVSASNPTPAAGFQAQMTGQIRDLLDGPGTWLAQGVLFDIINTSCAGTACADGSSSASAKSDAKWSSTFTLDVATDYVLGYNFQASAVDSASASFSMQLAKYDTGTGTYIDLLGPFNESSDTAFSLSDTLAPGQYSITAQLHGFAGGANGAVGSVEAESRAEFRLLPVPVPLPAAAWLLMSGMGGLAAFARRRKQLAAA